MTYYNALAEVTLTTHEREMFFTHLLKTKDSVEEAINRLGIESVDSNEIEVLCRELLDANPQVIDDVKK